MAIYSSRNAVITAATLVFSVAAILFVSLGEFDRVRNWTTEDGVFENLSALFYLIGFFIGVFYVVRFGFNATSVLWIFLCFVFLGEETSWFQRILGYSVPFVEENNAQGEFNFHNLSVFQGGSVLDAEFQISDLLKSQNIFRMGFFSYFILLPILFRFEQFGNWMRKFGYILPSKWFSLTLVIIFTTSFLLVFVLPELRKHRLAETREMLYSLYIMAYVFLFTGPSDESNFTDQAD